MNVRTFLFLLALTITATFVWQAPSSPRPGGQSALAAEVPSRPTPDPSWAELRPRTPAEITASVTPVNPAYPELNVLRYALNAKPGTTDMTQAFRAAIAVAKQYAGGAEIQVPRGDYRITSTLALDGNRLHLRGTGEWSTRLIFAPTADGTLLELGGSGAMRSQGSVTGMALYSSDAKFTKIAIDIIDVSAWVIRDVAIQGSIVNGNSSYWSGGKGSIGIRVRGREATSLGPIFVYADQPIRLSRNPNMGIDIDHFHFSDSYLVGNGFPIVTIDSGVNLTDVTFDGYQAWARGTYGLYWVDTATSHIGSGLTLRNVRWEQGTSARDYLVRIEHNYGLEGLVIENCFGGVDRNGFRLRNVRNVTIAATHYTGSIGRTALDIDASVKRIALLNAFWQTGSTVNVTGQRQMFAAPKNPGAAPLPNFAYYDEAR